MARIRIRIDVTSPPQVADVSKAIEEMVRSGIEEHFGVVEAIDVNVDHIEVVGN